MTPSDYCWWLRGFCELSGLKSLNEKQFKMLKDHLDLVFTKITPDRDEQPEDDSTKPPLGKLIDYTKFRESLERTCSNFGATTLYC